MPKLIQPHEITALLKPGLSVFIPGCAGESLLLAKALQENPQCAEGVHFVGVWIPGINAIDYAALHHTATATCFFATPALRNSFSEGKVRFIPLHYSDLTHYLRSLSFDLAFFQVSPPNSDGFCSFGVTADFPPSIIDRVNTLVGHINPMMPTPPNAPSVPYESFDYVVEEKYKLIEYDLGKDTESLRRLGVNVASLINDGDTIQIGLGKIQATVLDPLSNHKDLRLYGGMICDPLIKLIESGATAKADHENPAVTTGVAIGSRELYDFVANSDQIAFRPATHTHDIEKLGQINNLVAINSAIEVDLLGQVNAEMINGKQVSGSGGLVDFLRGARRSIGGRAIVALVSTTSDGKISRIVDNFSTSTVTTVPRTDIDYVITENGIADLRNKSLAECATALIEEAAAPQFKNELREKSHKKAARRST